MTAPLTHKPGAATPGTTSGTAIGSASGSTSSTATRAALDATAPTAGGQQLQLVTFEVGDEEFGIDILAVQEINRMLPITRVPQSPPSVEGVINLRGRIIPVVDLRKRFDLVVKEHGHESRIIVVEVGGRVLGFIVERVNEVLRVDSSIVEPPPQLTASASSDYIRGVGKLKDRLLILLDLERLFNAQALDAADQVVKQAA